MSIETTETTESTAFMFAGRQFFHLEDRALGQIVSQPVEDAVPVVIGSDWESSTVPLKYVVPLPRMGENVEVIYHSEQVAGYWLGLVPQLCSGDSLTYRLSVDGRMLEFTHTATALDARDRVRDFDAAGAPIDVVALAEAYETLNAAHESFRQWREDLTDAAHEMANSENLCGEFDDFMNVWGLRRRQSDFDVTVRVVGFVRMVVTADRASDSYDLSGLVDSAEVARRIAAGEVESWSTEVEDYERGDG